MSNLRILLFFLVFPCVAGAQMAHFDSLLIQISQYTPSFWQNGQNAAALAWWPQPQYGSTQLTYNQANGAFRRPQEPKMRKDFLLHTEGLRQVGKWTYFGRFDYQKSQDRVLAYSHVNDPFDGNPFIWADTLAGDWQRDHIGAQIAVGSPVWAGRWRTGLGINYHVGQGARTRDPKPFYRLRNLELRPALHFQANARTHWGAVAHIGLKQEENEVGYYSDEFPLLYRLRGYGTFSRTPTVTAERRRTGNVYKLLLQYQHFTLNNAQWLVQMGGGFRQEKTREGIATPTNGGDFGESIGELFLSWNKPAQQQNWTVELQLLNQNGSGRDPILMANSVSYNWLTASGRYGFWQNKTGLFRHLFLKPKLQVLQQSDQISRTDWNISNLTLTADWHERRPIRKAWLWYGIETGYRARLARAFAANRPTPLTTALVRPDYEILSANVLIINASTGIDWQFSSFPNLWNRINITAQTQRNSTLGNRQSVQINYAILY